MPWPFPATPDDRTVPSPFEQFGPTCDVRVHEVVGEVVRVVDEIAAMVGRASWRRISNGLADLRYDRRHYVLWCVNHLPSPHVPSPLPTLGMVTVTEQENN